LQGPGVDPAGKIPDVAKALLQQKARETAPVTAPILPDTTAEGPPDLMAALEEAMAAMRSGS
jgi:hypothetical protein